MENKLKSCPFCGCKDVKLTYIKGKNSHKNFYVWCSGCGTEGPFGLSLDSAMEAWNRRVVEK